MTRELRIAAGLAVVAVFLVTGIALGSIALVVIVPMAAGAGVAVGRALEEKPE